MKHLLLFRHAKSDWSDPALHDFDRPLNKRGRKAAPAMGKLLQKQHFFPDLVLCSTARRAQQTWDLAAEKLGKKIPVKSLKSLYLAPPSRILATLEPLPDDVSMVILVAHNPGLHNLAIQLAGPGSDETAVHELAMKYPTGALAVFEFHTESWRDVRRADSRLTAFFRPRDLG